MPSHDRSHELAKLAVAIQQAQSDETTANVAIEHAREMIPDVDWASLTIQRRRGTFTTLAATADKALRADELQYSLQQGPCIESAVDVEWQRSGSIRHDPRWPVWGPRAADLGIGSLLSIPLVTDEPIGALNMYAADEGRFTDRDDVDFAVIYGTHVAVALTSSREIGGLRTAIASRHTIGVAQGILMERFDLTLDASFALLRRYSTTRNTRIADIAADLVSTRQLPDDRNDSDDPDPGPAAPR
jgi:GAF domain-containing protein